MARFSLSVLAALCVLCAAQAQFIIQQQPLGTVSAQRVRTPELESAQVASNRIGGNFAYSVAESGPVDTVVQHIFAQPQFVPTVQTLPTFQTVQTVPAVQPVQSVQTVPSVQTVQLLQAPSSWQILPQQFGVFPQLATFPAATGVAGAPATPAAQPVIG